MKVIIGTARRRFDVLTRQQKIAMVSVFIFIIALPITVVALRTRLSQAPKAVHVPETPPQTLPETPPGPIQVKKVMVVNFDPVINSRGGILLHQVFQNDPVALESQYISDIRTASGNFITYQIVNRATVNAFPLKKDGFTYDEAAYLACISGSAPCHQPDLANYNKIIADYDLCGKKNRGEIDEVWLWGGPYFGYWEWVYAGPPPYDNSLLTISLKNTGCSKLLPIMGFSYERFASEMLEDLGHRVEGVMTLIYGGWKYAYGVPATNPGQTNKVLGATIFERTSVLQGSGHPVGIPLGHNSTPDTLWDQYTMRAAYQGWSNTTPGCGNVHLPPNSTLVDGHDWSNSSPVTSNCGDWLNFPNFTGATQTITCSTWNCDGYTFKKFWLNHLPKAEGEGNDGKKNNWWAYLSSDDILSLIQPTPTGPPSVPSPHPIDWTTSEPYQLLVGDVNDDNTITIEDVSAVLAKYTDFKVPVPLGTPEDVNADGTITIEDVALVLLNYSDFTIPGDSF